MPFDPEIELTFTARFYLGKDARVWWSDPKRMVLSVRGRSASAPIARDAPLAEQFLALGRLAFDVYRRPEENA